MQSHLLQEYLNYFLTLLYMCAKGGRRERGGMGEVGKGRRGRGVKREHWKGFSPLWMRLCVVKWANWVNAFGQRQHWKDFYLVQLYLCVVKWLPWLNVFWHREYWNGVSLLWLHLCGINSWDDLKAFWQRSIGMGFLQYGNVYEQLILEMI